MQNETVGDDFQAHLDSEDAREKVIKVVQYLKRKCYNTVVAISIMDFFIIDFMRD